MDGYGYAHQPQHPPPPQQQQQSAAQPGLQLPPIIQQQQRFSSSPQLAQHLPQFQQVQMHHHHQGQLARRVSTGGEGTANILIALAGQPQGAADSSSSSSYLSPPPAPMVSQQQLQQRTSSHDGGDFSSYRMPPQFAHRTAADSFNTDDYHEPFAAPTYYPPQQPSQPPQQAQSSFYRYSQPTQQQQWRWNTPSAPTDYMQQSKQQYAVQPMIPSKQSPSADPFGNGYMSMDGGHQQQQQQQQHYMDPSTIYHPQLPKAPQYQAQQPQQQMYHPQHFNPSGYQLGMHQFQGANFAQSASVAPPPPLQQQPQQQPQPQPRTTPKIGRPRKADKLAQQQATAAAAAGTPPPPPPPSLVVPGVRPPYAHASAYYGQMGMLPPPPPAMPQQEPPRPKAPPILVGTFAPRESKLSEFDKTVISKLLQKLTSKRLAEINWPFLEPVSGEDCDLNDYRSVVKVPMDFHTMDNKFKAGHYDTVDAFQADFKRMINNCYAFNGKDHVVSALGRRLETSFGRELKIARKVAKDKSLGESDFKPVNSDEENAMRILEDLTSDKNMMFAYPFLEPVDANSSPELRDYYKIIPKPMDLGTLQENLQAGLYRTIDLFVADVRLLFANCYRFHGADAEIAKLAQKLETVFEQKVTLLPYALRVKTQLATAMPIGATAEDNGGPNTPDSAGRSSRRPKLAVTHSVLKAIEEEQNKQARLDRKRKREDYHEKVEALQARVSSWLSTYGAPEILEVVRKRWLTASLGHLVALLPQPLVVPTCPLEWELGIVYPKQSALMSRLMGYLMPELKNPNPPYESWEPFLRVIAEEEGDTDFAALGIDDRLSLLQKLLIAALDNSEDIQNHLRDLPLESNRGVMLGTDGEGIQYHHFPSFSARRVYKLHPKLLEKQERQRIKFSKSLSKQASLLTTLPVASPLPNSLAAAAAAAGIPEDLLDRRRSSRLQSPAKGPNDVMSPSTPSATSFDDITESASSIVGTLDEGEDAFQLCCGTVLEMKDLVETLKSTRVLSGLGPQTKTRVLALAATIEEILPAAEAAEPVEEKAEYYAVASYVRSMQDLNSNVEPVSADWLENPTYAPVSSGSAQSESSSAGAPFS